LGKPCITMDDTEHVSLGHKLYTSFASTILTPSTFSKDFGEKHIKFKSLMELAYLHPNYFKPDESILKTLGVRDDQRFIIIRFVSWGASHDFGQSGLDNNTKEKIVDELSCNYKIFISSENHLPDKFKKYEINIPPDKIHDVLSKAYLYIGEGGTMASEAALLGTPSIYVNSLSMGYLEELERNDLLFSFRNPEGVLEKAKEILNNSNSKITWQRRREKIISENIDLTSFLVWFIENYPESFRQMKDDPDYQYNFQFT